MSKDIQCPYCGREMDVDSTEIEIDERNEMQCKFCEKNFVFIPEVEIVYSSYKAKCLNGGEHNFQATKTYPVEFTKMECWACGERREPTEEEWKTI